MSAEHLKFLTLGSYLLKLKAEALKSPDTQISLVHKALEN